MDATLTQQTTSSRILHNSTTRQLGCRNLKTVAHSYAMATLLVGVSAVTTAVSSPVLNRDNDVMIFFLAAYLTAAKFGLGPALWACILSIFCFDFFITPPLYQLDPVMIHHVITFAMMFILIFAASERTARIRQYARTLEERVVERTQELAKSNEELVEEVQRRRETEEQLKISLDELAKSNAALQQFARIASHDLQEPLKVIQGYIHLLSKRYRGKFDQSADEFLDYTVDATVRMERLIRGVLQHASVSSKLQAFEPVDAQNAFNDAYANLQDSIAKSGAVVKGENLPRITGDAMQITQLFQNLIGNALKFQRQEGQPVISVSARRTVDGWLFAVADNGIGIEQIYLERIFGLFSRLHSAAQYPGTGLGLAICKAVVDHHNGRIWVESTPGIGSTFYFTIPDRTVTADGAKAITGTPKASTLED